MEGYHYNLIINIYIFKVYYQKAKAVEPTKAISMHSV